MESEDTPEAVPGPGEDHDPAAVPRWAAWEVALLVVVAALPVVRAYTHWRSGWVLVGDNANIAIRAQDVGTRHTPLLGMPSGLVNYAPGTTTHHPGPLIFWFLGPWVRLLGTGPLVVLLGAATVASAAGTALVWSVRRLTGPAGTVASVAVLVLTLAVTDYDLSQPLNPAAALLPALAALAAAALVLSGDDRGLPVLVVTASYAAQAELAYTVVMLVVGAVVAATLVVRRRRGAGPVAATPWARRSASVALVACWSGPLLDLAVNGGGNVRATWDASRIADTRPQGLDAALDALRSIAHPLGWADWVSGEPRGGPGTVLVTVVALTAAGLGLRGAWRRDRRRTGAVLAVVATAAVATAVTQSFTPGPAGRSAPYLLPVVAAGGFLWLSAGALLGLGRPRFDRRSGTVAVVVLLAVALGPGWAVLDGRRAVDPGSAAVDDLADQARRSLDADRPVYLVARGGPNSQSLLRGVGLQLEDGGLDIGYVEFQANYVGGHRTVPDETTSIDRLVITRPFSSGAPDHWRRVARWTPPGFDRAHLDRLRARVASELRAEGVRLTNQARGFQAGPVLVATGAGEGIDLMDRDGLIRLGEETLAHPDRLTRLPDLTLAALAEENVVSLSPVDEGLRGDFYTATTEDVVELWLIPAGR